MVIVYTDKITGHELISDSYNLEPMYEGIAFFVKSNKVTEEALDLGIETEDGDAGDGGAERVNNITHFFNYQATSYKKKEYMTYIKSFIKRTLASIEDEERQALFKTQSMKLVKFILANIKEIDFFINQENNEEGMVVAGHWTGEEGPNDGPTMIYFVDAMKSQKY